MIFLIWYQKSGIFWKFLVPVEFYSAIKQRMETLPLTTPRMKLEAMMLNETQKEK